MKVLITGADGFLGRYLAAALLDQQHVVCGIHHGPLKKAANPKVLWWRADVTDTRSMRRIVGEFRPQAVVHLAAMAVPRLSWSAIPETFRVNVRGTLSVLEALRLEAPAARLLFASSIQVYGQQFQWKSHLREEDIPWPHSPYGASKAVAELACLNYAAQAGLDVIIMRLTNSLGKGLSAELVFPEWCRQIAGAERSSSRRVLETGNLGVWREFLNVKDTAAAMELLLRRGRRGQIYNICTGRVELLKGYVDFLRRQSAVPLKVVTRKARLRPMDPRVMSTAGRKIRKLGWRPQHSVRAALTEILSEWRQRE